MNIEINISIRSEECAFRTVTISLVLRCNHSNKQLVVSDEDDFGVIKRQLHLIKSLRHQPTQFECLS